MLINLVSSIIVFVISMGINFFLAPFILKNLGNEAYGFVGLSNAIVAYASVVTVAINSVSGRFVAFWWHKGDISRANRYYSSVLVVNIFFSLLVIVACVIFILNIDYVLNIPQDIKTDVSLTFIFYFINFCVGLFNGIITVCAFIQNKLYLLSIRNAFASIILAVAIVLLFYFFTPMIAYLAVGALISSTFVFISTLYMSASITPELKFSFNKFDIKKLKELLNSGIWSSFSALNNILLTGMDLFICNIFLGANITGVLSVAKAAPLILESFCAQLSSIFAPKLVQLYSNGDTLGVVAEAKFSMRVIAYVMGAPSAFFIAFGYDFYKLWLPFKTADEIETIYNLSIISFIPVILIGHLFSLFSLDSVTNKLFRPAVANTILGIGTICAQILILKFSDFGIYGVVVVGALLYGARILLFDLLNAALNLGVKFSTFYATYFQNLAFFCLTCIAFYWLRSYIEITNWLNFISFAILLVFIGYLFNVFFIFSNDEKNIIKAKILSKFKRKI